MSVPSALVARLHRRLYPGGIARLFLTNTPQILREIIQKRVQKMHLEVHDAAKLPKTLQHALHYVSIAEILGVTQELIDNIIESSPCKSFWCFHFLFKIFILH